MLVETVEAVKKGEKALPSLLNDKHREDLEEILAIGEKYRREGKEMKYKFWKERAREDFDKLVVGYKGRKKDFIDGLEEKEIEIISKLNEIERRKFIEEYMKDMIIYSGDIEIEEEYEKKVIEYNEEKYPGKEGLKRRTEDMKDSLQPGMEINLHRKDIGADGVSILAKGWKNSLQPGMNISLGGNYIGTDGVLKLAKEWKYNLQPGMNINLWNNNIGADGIAKLAKEWKESLQPGMNISLWNNNIGAEGVEKLAKEWKNSLQPGMSIGLGCNNIGAEGVEKLAKEWKNSLQTGMTIELSKNNIGDEGISILAKEWKDSLQPGMKIDLSNNKIGDKGADEIMKITPKDGVVINVGFNSITTTKKEELKKRAQRYKDKGINVEIRCEE